MVNTYNEKNSLPDIERIEVVSGAHYSQCRATVDVNISDGNGGKRNITVEYPMQGDMHITALMRYKDTKGNVSHDIKMPIIEAIDNATKGSKIV
jgi:hypothetical protein